MQSTCLEHNPVVHIYIIQGQKMSTNT